jgi:hypothetical protein
LDGRSGAEIFDMDKHDEVREKAYHLWIAEGRPHGRDKEHWHKAMELVHGKSAAASRAPGKSKAPAAKAASVKAQPSKSQPVKGKGGAPRKRT